MPAETTQVHTKLLKCALEIEDSRAYWRHADPSQESPNAERAFEEYWFGAKSLARIKVLLTNFRSRYADYPESLAVLHDWRHMEPETRTLICHWHLQLADPLYRDFTGSFLPERRDSHRPEVTRDLVVRWVEDQGPGRWTMTTRIQFASKLLSAAYGAGLVASNRDPRPLALPRVPDAALAYLMYLLRSVEFGGTLLDNPYARSVGLDQSFLEDRLRALEGLDYRRQGDLQSFGWAYPTLTDWARAMGIQEAV